MLLIIDNYDSFTYNLYHYFGELGYEAQVHRNDEITVDEVAVMQPDHIVLSPGPCTPNEAGISLQVVDKFSGHTPILGICLGHQSIGQMFGSNIVKAKHVMHGKTSEIHHNGLGVFSGLPSPFLATRYHSLVVDEVPLDMELTGWTLKDGAVDEIMGLRHKEHFVEGVQFHPESVLTEHGHALLANFINCRR